VTQLPASGSTLALAPGTTSPAPGAGANTEPTTGPGRYPTLANTPKLSPYAIDTAIQRVRSGDYFAWLDHVWPAAGCRRPVRLRGRFDEVHQASGEVLATAWTSDMPDGVIYKACGNRRHEVCPWCAWTYQGDAYQIIKAGLVGGHGIPAHVSRHPAVFATFTAPSFGPVHTRRITRCVCGARPAGKDRCSCLPAPCHARRNGTADVCPHGITLACWKRHSRDDVELGTPLCPDCYDHDHQVVWNHFSGQLWHRTKQAIERHLNRQARLRGLPKVRVSHGKAAEYQVRGVVHFHALLRLDGIDPTDPDHITPPPAGFTAADLDEAVRHARDTITFTTPGHPAKAGGWPIGWGDPQGQDIQVVSLSGDNTVTDGMVGSYLAKYATKGTEITGHTSRRLRTDTIDLYADPQGSHTERLIAACWTLGDPGPDPDGDFVGLRRWAHMLGFGGHFLTKARRYSITFTNRRQARIIYRRTQTVGSEYEEPRSLDQYDYETTLVIGTLTYAGTGWHTTGDALLANTAADQARSRQQVAREELAHEIGSKQQRTAA
jgi:hypothetical protein